MTSKFSLLSVLIFLCIYENTSAQYNIRQPNAIPLHGEWSFALDPAEMGVPGKWFTDKVSQAGRFDKVTVPHCFSADPR